MTKSMFIELIPVAFFIIGTISIGYLFEVSGRVKKLHRYNKKEQYLVKQVEKCIEYSKAM